MGGVRAHRSARPTLLGTRWALGPVSREIAPHLLGRDPRQVDRIGDVMDAALDVACWDLFGKALGLPVCELLGGSTGVPMAMLSSIHTGQPEEMRASVAEHRSRGVYNPASMVTTRVATFTPVMHADGLLPPDAPGLGIDVTESALGEPVSV